MDIDDTVRDHQEVFFDQLSSFVVEHANTTRTIVQTLREDWGPSLWDAWTDTASIDFSHTRDRTDLVTTMGPAALNNVLLHRTILMFTSLQLELQTLAEEAIVELIPPLCLYGADPTTRDDDAARGLGKMLPHLMDVWNWHDRCKKVVLRTVHQMSRTFSATHERGKLAPFQSMRLPSLWNAMYDCLGAVAMVDEVLSRHDIAQKSAVILQRVLDRVKQNPDKYGEDVNVEYVEQSARLLKKLDRDLLHRTLLASVVAQEFDTPDAMVTVNEVLFNIAAEHLMDSTVLLTELIAQNRERKEERRRVIGVAAAFYWFCTLFDARLSVAPHTTLRNRITEQLYALQKVSPVVFIYGDSSVKVGQWLSQLMPHVIGQAVKEPTKEALAAVKEALAKKRRLLVEGTKQYRRDVAQWVSLMRATYSHERTKAKGLIRMMTALLIRGVFVAQNIQRLIHEVFSLHVAAGEGMSKSMVEQIMTLVSMLMTIRNTVHSKTSTIATMFSLIAQCQAYAIQRDLFELQGMMSKKQTQQNNGLSPLQNEALTDQLCAVQQAFALLGQPPTRQTLALIDVSLSIVFRRRGLLEELAARADNCFRLLGSLRDVAMFQKRLTDATDCSVLYWQPECLPIFIKTVYDRPALSQELIFLVQALQDCRDPLQRGKHDSGDSLQAEFEKVVEEHIEQQIIMPLLTEIETDLRLHIHAGVRGMPYKKLGDGPNGPRTPKDLGRLCRLPPMFFFSRILNISRRLEDALDRNFYDLNALNPNDWKAYDEMRTLATKKYGLHLLEGHLPGSIVDQGLDVLVITKNINVFIAHYAYNLNEQVFIQRPQLTEAKHLNALHIRHVANSIRTHGTGIMSTTVHYVFKCLLKKLNVISEFLYDDVIKSKLLKEIKLFEQYKEKMNRRFAFERAEKFNTDMRNIGSTDDGKTYLDRFRQVVTEVGNALGYVRMVRSGGLRSVADAAVAIPDLENVPLLEKCFNPKAKRPDEEGKGGEDDEDEEDEEDFDLDEEEECEDASATISPTTADSVKIVDQVVHGMMKKLSDGSDYFRMLVDAVSKRLADNKKYAHLKNFHVIIPPMSISFVAMLVNQKEKLTKKNKDGLFCDDGFALGCSFLLSLFRIEQNFDSLHWFDSAIHHLRSRRQAETQELAESRESQKNSRNRGGDQEDTFAADSIQLSIAVLDQSIHEYMSLHHAFNSCRVFFTQKKKEEEQDEEDEEDEGAAAAAAASQ